MNFQTLSAKWREDGGSGDYYESVVMIQWNIAPQSLSETILEGNLKASACQSSLFSGDATYCQSSYHIVTTYQPLSQPITLKAAACQPL